MECCRMCLGSDDLINIFTIEDIVQKIFSIASFLIEKNDGLPQYICLLCRHELDICLNFREKCKQTHRLLTNRHTKIKMNEKIMINVQSSEEPSTFTEDTKNAFIKSIKRKFEDMVETENNSKKNNIRTSNENYSDESDREFEICGPKRDESSDSDDSSSDYSEFELYRNGDIGSETFMCSECNFFFNVETEYNSHLDMFHSNTKEQCQICLTNFPNQNEMLLHLKEKHDIVEDVDSDDEKAHKCRMCGEIFNYQSELNSHLCSQSTKHIKCVYCNNTFSSKSNLERHIELAHSNYTCDSCGKDFGVYLDYEKHLEHAHSKDLRCEICERFFEDTELLEQHKKLHIGSIVFECNICQNLFVSEYLLNKHMKVHNQVDKSGEENEDSVKNSEIGKNSEGGQFVCPFCEKCFKTADGMHVHAKSHTDDTFHQAAYMSKNCGNSAGRSPKSLLYSQQVDLRISQHGGARDSDNSSTESKSDEKHNGHSSTFVERQIEV